MENSGYKVKLKSFKNIYHHDVQTNIKYWFWGLVLFGTLLLFMPWTQNIKSKGIITTLKQENRPQDINSPIPGKIMKWWVKEGDFVQKGDTILQLSEIKEEYLDPNLIGRTQEQVEAKKGAKQNYQNKLGAIKNQIAALLTSKKLKTEQLNNKLKQLENKLSAERAEILAINNEFNLSKDQYERQQKMFDAGLVSQTQLQQRNLSYQNALSKKITAENKLAQTQQEAIILKIEQNNIEQEYNEKISKIEGDRFQNLSQIATYQGEIAKLENSVTNYTIRNGMYIILAPQSGQIIQAKKAGIGEILKDGERITIIVPSKMDYAVEMFVRPVDLPLINIGQKVRFMFDGFPAIVFSGWPKNSYGTFGGKIVAYENNINENGLFRILVAEDKQDKEWPEQLKLGTGAQCITLLKNVPIWYEIWRNINGFPPDFYSNKNTNSKNKK